MTTITISIPDDHLRKLQEIAKRLNLTPEQLARIGVEDLLGKSDESFEELASYVLRKNEELYRKLA